MSEKKTSWILGVTLLFVLAGVGETFAAWDGKAKTRPSKTEMVGKKEFFLIENEANLAWFADSVNSTEGSVSANAKLVANLDMGQNLFVPIAAGIGATSFAGVFDGNGHTISNLYIDAEKIGKVENKFCPEGKSNCNAQNVGFIAVMQGGTIKNLALEKVNLTASTNAGDIVGKDQPVTVGIAVAWMKTGTVEGVSVSGNILTSGVGNSAGGVVGNAWAGAVSNSLSSANILVNGNESYAGGVVGCIRKTGALTLSSCAFDGDNILNNGDGKSGGIVGLYEAGELNVSKCYFDTDVASEGLGKKTDGLEVEGDFTGVKNVNTAKVSCDLNTGKWESNACSAEGVWSMGESHIALNGVARNNNGDLTYAVTFNANEGKFPEGAKSKKFLRAGETITAAEITTPVHGDTVFGGWALSADATGPAAELGTVSQAVTIYAYWKNMFVITFDANGGTFPGEGTPTTVTKKVAEGEAIDVSGINLPTTYTSEGGVKYYFMGWATTNDATEALASLGNASAATTFYAIWTEAPTFTVVFNTQKNTGTTVAYVQEGGKVTKPADPEALGYTFDGWYTDKACATAFDFATVITESVELFAKWTPVTYKITYELDKGTNNEDNLASYTVESETVVFLKPSKTGFVFEGWYYDSKFTQAATQITQGSTGNKTLYAKWSVRTFAIIYMAGTYGLEVVPSDVKQYDVPIKLRGSSYTRKGYLQDGWSTKDGGTKNYDLDATYSKNGSLTLYPYWVVDPMSIGNKPEAVAAGFGVMVQNRSLQVSNIKAGTRVSVMDMQGRLVRSGIAGSTGLKVQGLVSGSYVVRVNGQSRQVRVR